jgi:hypothetical protein
MTVAKLESPGVVGVVEFTSKFSNVKPVGIDSMRTAVAAPVSFALFTSE